MLATALQVDQETKKQQHVSSDSYFLKSHNCKIIRHSTICVVCNPQGYPWKCTMEALFCETLWPKASPLCQSQLKYSLTQLFYVSLSTTTL